MSRFRLPSMSSVAEPTAGDDLPLFPAHRESSRRSKPAMSRTLAELLDDTSGNTTPAHWALEMGFAGAGGFFPAPAPATYPFVLSFSDLTYSVRVRRKMGLPSFTRRRPGSGSPARSKVLLNGISGEAREGEITAVMGASGSGKSTLVDALADRIARDSLGGAVRLNGEVLESKVLKVISAYVMQDDLLFPMLTVEETLMFSAEFRLPRSLPKAKKRARVQALIDQLGLRSAAGTVIGDEGHRGVSGGERRRVSIGTDIVHDPILLFLDEPTSGLDSTSAFMVVKVLQRIAQSGSVVIMTVHQPSYRILSLLDRLIFLSHGDTVYSGSPANLPRFFADFGNPIPENENRTEFALDLIRELEESPEGTKRLVEFHRSRYNKETEIIDPDLRSRSRSGSGPKLSLVDAISNSISRGKLVSGGATLTPPNQILASASASASSSVQKFANPIWTEIAVIGRRSMTNSRRMPELFTVRLGAVLVTGTILATMFYHLDSSPRGVQERIGFFAFAMSTTFYTCAEAIPVFLQERHIFLRETAYNAYRRSSYVLAHSIISVPSLILLSLAFSATTYFAVGLAGGGGASGGFIFFFITVLAAFWSGSSFVTFLSGVVSHVMLGYTVVVAILAYFLLFSGFFISRDRVPGYWLWFHYLSLVKYPFEGVLRNEFGDPGRCFVRGLQMFDTTPLGAVPEALKVRLLESMSGTLGVNITRDSCVTNGLDVLRMQGVTQLGKWGCLWITVAWGFFFRVLFYFSLMFGGKNKRS